MKGRRGRKERDYGSDKIKAGSTRWWEEESESCSGKRIRILFVKD